MGGKKKNLAKPFEDAVAQGDVATARRLRTEAFLAGKRPHDVYEKDLLVAAARGDREMLVFLSSCLSPGKGVLTEYATDALKTVKLLVTSFDAEKAERLLRRHARIVPVREQEPYWKRATYDYIDAILKGLGYPVGRLLHEVRRHYLYEGGPILRHACHIMPNSFRAPSFVVDLNDIVFAAAHAAPEDQIDMRAVVGCMANEWKRYIRQVPQFERLLKTPTAAKIVNLDAALTEATVEILLSKRYFERKGYAVQDDDWESARKVIKALSIAGARPTVEKFFADYVRRGTTLGDFLAQVQDEARAWRRWNGPKPL